MPDVEQDVKFSATCSPFGRTDCTEEAAAPKDHLERQLTDRQPDNHSTVKRWRHVADTRYVRDVYVWRRGLESQPVSFRREWRACNRRGCYGDVEGVETCLSNARGKRPTDIVAVAM